MELLGRTATPSGDQWRIMLGINRFPGWMQALSENAELKEKQRKTSRRGQSCAALLHGHAADVTIDGA